MENNTPDFSYLKEANISPKIQELTKKIQVRQPQLNTLTDSESYNPIPSVNDLVSINKDNRIKTADYSTPFLDVYQPLSSGEYVSKYKNYIPNIDNQEYAAQRQSTGDKWSNGIKKALLKTGNAVLGGTVGTVYGIGKWIQEGSLSALYDNSFSNTLADWDTKLNYQLPNYYTKQEQDLGLFGQAKTANFWSDKVLGGLSFTAGAILSEAIWASVTGGASLATKAATAASKGLKFTRWGVEALGEESALVGLAKNKAFLKQALPNTAFNAAEVSKDLAIGAGKAADLFNTARFTLTSAGYESSVEALQFRKEQEEKFFNGVERTPEEIQKFYKDLESSANAVFGVNMAIVGSSNLVTMGKLFELKNPIKTGVTDFIERKAFGYGIDKEAMKVLTPTKGQKIARNIFAYSKAPITEGLYEEGFQGVTSKAASKWLDHTYNDKNTNDTFNLIGEVYNSLSEQYGTKEGWVENGVGMIIGALGGTTNTRAELKAKEQELNFQAKGLEAFDNNTLQKAILPKKIMMANQISGFSEEAKVEAQKGNIIKSQLAGEGVIHAFLNHKYALKEDMNDTIEEISKALNSITVDQFKEAGIQPSEIEDYKKETLDNFKQKARQFKKNRVYSEYIVGRNKTVGSQEIGSILGDTFENLDTNEALIQSLTWVLTEGENASKYMNDIRGVISNELGDEQSTVAETISKIKQLQPKKRAQLTKTTNQYKAFISERDKVTKELNKLNNAPKETEGDTTNATRRLSLNNRLLELDEKVNTLESELNNLAEELNKNQSYLSDLEGVDLNQNISTNFITSDTLLNLNDNLQKFENIVNSFKETNPQKYQYLTDLIDEYAQAEDVFLTNQITANKLSKGELKIEKANTWLGSKLKGKKSMDEATREWLTEILKKYETNVLAANQEQNQTEGISDEEYNEFIDNNNVTETRLRDIAKKVKEKQPLTNRENSIFVSKTSDINSIIKEDQGEIKPKKQEVKIENLSDKELYKQKIEKLLKDYYGDLSYVGDTYDGVSNEKPTQEDIDKYRELKQNKEYNSPEYRRLLRKLSNWKLLSSAVDEDNTSIAQMIDLLSQLDEEIQQEDTKDEVTKEDTVYLSEAIAETETVVDYSWAQNTLGSVTVKKKDGKYRFSHLKMSYIANQLGNVEGNKDLNNLKPNETVIIDGTPFTYKTGGVIEVSEEDFNSRQQALNMYITDTGAVTWSYKNVNTVKENGDFVKLPSQFIEDINPTEIANIQEGDTLKLTIKEDGWNKKLLDKYNKARTEKTKKEALDNLKSQLKIFITTQNGVRVSTLKSSLSDVIDDNFNMLREEAFKRYIDVEDKSDIDLGIKVKVDKVFLGSPELYIQDGAIQNMSITKEAASQIEATGYIKDGEISLNKNLTDVDKTFVGRISKANQGKKVPIIVFKKGKYSIAYPISMVKSNNSQVASFDAIMESNISPQEKIQKINQEIQNNSINTPKLVFKDINNQEKLNITREAFQNKERFTTADELANPNYKSERLVFEGKINIDLENLDRAISDMKIRIDLKSLEYTATSELKNNSLVEIEESLNNIAEEFFSIYLKNGNITNTHFTNTFDNNIIEKNATNNLKIKRNIKILREAMSKRIPKALVEAIGKEKLDKVNKLFKQYDAIKKQIVVKEADIKSGKENSDCK